MSKYGNNITIVDNISFMSRKEASRYLDLKRLLQHKQISNLELQPSYPIVIKGKRICKVILDFRYIDNSSHQIIIEDVKGHDTQISKLKRKIVEAEYGIKVILL